VGHAKSLELMYAELSSLFLPLNHHHIASISFGNHKYETNLHVVFILYADKLHLVPTHV
jgi:hypothetical protein